MPRPLLTFRTKSARLSLFLSGDRLTRPSGHPASLFSRLFKSRYGPQSRRPRQSFRHFCTLEQGNRCTRLALRPHIPRCHPFSRERREAAFVPPPKSAAHRPASPLARSPSEVRGTPLRAGKTLCRFPLKTTRGLGTPQKFSLRFMATLFHLSKNCIE